MNILDIIKKFQEMPGDYKSVNIFDAIYGGISLGLVETLGRSAKLLDKIKPGLINKWDPSKKLEILFLAYSGARNTGAEVRTVECIDQLNQVLGNDYVNINMTTLDIKQAEEYYSDHHVNLIEFSSVFFPEVFKLVLDNHVVVLVEGSAWKENFAAALLMFFIYGAGLAGKMGKVSFSYAVDAGKMNKINNFLSWYLSKDMTKIITRSEDSNHVLADLSLPGAINRVDTAWTQRANSSQWADDKIKSQGWDGKKPLIGMAMQNYFWWPVIPDVVRYAKSLVTGDVKNQYKLIYYYDYSKKDEENYQEFARTIANTLDWTANEYDAQPVLIGMEALDHTSLELVSSMMKNKPVILSCTDFSGDEMAALLRELTLLITTRYHAMVLSMPGKVPFIGLSRDERIWGVMKELDLIKDYYVEYDEPDMPNKLKRMVKNLMKPKESQRVKDIITQHLPYYYAQMGMLGLDIRKLIKNSFPGIRIKSLDENNLMELIPHCPDEYIDHAQEKFAEIKKREGA